MIAFGDPFQICLQEVIIKNNYKMHVNDIFTYMFPVEINQSLLLKYVPSVSLAFGQTELFISSNVFTNHVFPVFGSSFVVLINLS